MPETLPLSKAGRRAVDLGNSIYILDNYRVNVYPIVKRGYI